MYVTYTSSVDGIAVVLTANAVDNKSEVPLRSAAVELVTSQCSIERGSCVTVGFTMFEASTSQVW